ncbi:cytochrome b [uncultured Maricaulis sp.]|uniref:cytochrome b n=1 Tax=uncultured Maricaulis sp. TaxID=174710 RepID=UPI0030DABF27|tara:strand:- start:41078 stop:41659 length:582 start_codon:yes stop_codon:yes gene_type:complete
MTESKNYTSVAIILHWTLAILLIGMVFYAWHMDDLRQALRAQTDGVTLADVQFAVNAHKTVGMLVLLLSFARLGWRFAHTPPAMPVGMAGWEKLVASLTHIAFYVLMVGMPLLGWVAASTSQAPSMMFNNPDLILPRLPVSQDHDFHELVGEIHGKGGWAILILAGLHFAAAIKHQYLDKDGLMRRMLPFMKG